MFKLVKLLAIVVLVFSIVPAVQARPVASSTPSCVPAGDTGLTTLIVAKNHEHIAGMTIDATGCDVGIFVPPDSKNVVIRDDEIFGANIHAIFVQDSTHVLIDHNNGPDAHIENTMIVKNVENGSTLPGLVLHANAPRD